MSMKPFITRDTPVTEELLNAIAHLPTKSLAEIVKYFSVPWYVRWFRLVRWHVGYRIAGYRSKTENA